MQAMYPKYISNVNEEIELVSFYGSCHLHTF